MSAAGQVVWANNAGRVVRTHDLVRVDGLRGYYAVAARQPWPDTIAIVGCDRSGRWTTGFRFVTPDRVHVRRAATKRLHAS